MNRGTIIALVSGVAGVLVAGSIASVAVINAASGAGPTDTVAVAAVTDSVTNPPAPAPQAQTLAPAPQAQTPAPAPRTISAQDAAATVLAAAGGEAIEAQRVIRGGYDAWAITVSRTDGSVVRGFVEATSGVIFDWNSISGPAQAAPSKNSGYENDEHKGGDDD